MAAKPKTLILLIAERVQALAHCKAGRGHSDWIGKHEDAIDRLQRELPRGSGIDNGTKIDLDRSTFDKVVLTAGFHHMDQHGGYAGWTDHTITVQPSFHGIYLKISGRDRNDIKDYLYQTYEYALTRLYVEEYDADKGTTFAYVPGEAA